MIKYTNQKSVKIAMPQVSSTLYKESSSPSSTVDDKKNNAPTISTPCESDHESHIPSHLVLRKSQRVTISSPIPQKCYVPMIEKVIQYVMQKHGMDFDEPDQAKLVSNKNMIQDIKEQVIREIQEELNRRKHVTTHVTLKSLKKRRYSSIMCVDDNTEDDAILEHVQQEHETKRQKTSNTLTMRHTPCSRHENDTVDISCQSMDLLLVESSSLEELKQGEIIGELTPFQVDSFYCQDSL